MIMEATRSVVVFKSFVVFLFSWESFFPTKIRQASRIGGAFPLLICQGGSLCYTIGSVPHHICRVIIFDVISSKFRNQFHSQIWDPGISIFGSDNRTMKFRLPCIVHPCFLFSKPVDPVLFLTNLRVWKQYCRDDTFLSAFGLGFGLIQVRILYYDEGDACKFGGFAISILVLAFPNQPSNVHGSKSPSTLWNSFSRCEVTLFLFWSLAQWAITEEDVRNCITLKKHMRPANNNGLGTMETEIMVTTEQRWIGCYISHDPDPFQATYQCFTLIGVMRKAFGSFIYKMLALYKYMKRGLNRFYLLPVRLLLESRVTSTSSSKLGFNFLYLFQWLYLNGSMYHVSCKTLMQ